MPIGMYTQYTRNIIFKPQRKTYIIIENKKSIRNAREHKINIEVDDRVDNIGIGIHNIIFLPEAEEQRKM